MMDNIIVGPILFFQNNESYHIEAKRAFEKGFFPLCVITKGELFDQALFAMQEDQKKLIIAAVPFIAYNITYHE